jgi:hypothetical protein
VIHRAVTLTLDAVIERERHDYLAVNRLEDVFKEIQTKGCAS